MEAIQKNNHINAILPVLIIILFIVSFLPVLQKLALRWNNEDNSYCYLIIPLFLYLLYDRKDNFKFSEFSWNLWGIVPVILSVLLIIIGELGSVETLLYTGVWGCVAGLCLILYGRRVRHLFFPLVILAFIVPLPPFINRILTFQLKLAASTISVEMLRIFGVSVLQEGNIIDLGVDQLQVVDACSGLRYLMPMILLALLIGYFFSKGWWRRTILLIIVPPLSIFVNAFRIFITGILTAKGHQELAQSFFHDFSGWLVFMVAAGLLIAAAFILKKTGRVPKVRKAVDHGGRTVELALPIFISITLCFLFIGSGWALQKLPSAKNLPDRKSLSNFPMQLGQWQGKRHNLSDDILNSLWADDYVSATYLKQESLNQISLLVPFYEYQGTRHTAHAPQSCMLGGGWEMFNSGPRIIKMQDGHQIEIMTMIWKKANTRLLGSYFFFQRGRVITSPWMNKFYLMLDAFMKRRTDGALVRVEMTIPTEQSEKDAYKILGQFVSLIWEELPEYVPL